MAYGSAGTALKIFMLLLLIGVLLVGGAIWFDFLGIIDAKNALSPVTSYLGIDNKTPVVSDSGPIVLDRERMRVQSEALALRNQELDERESSIALAEAQILQKSSELDEKEISLTEKESSLNEAIGSYDNKKANLEQNARYLEGMPPEKSVAILVEMDELDVVDVLRTAERLAVEEGRNSLVSYWISLMEAKKGASIQKIMAAGI